jgi:hypothetical protein
VSTERRDKSMKERVQPIKDHLSRISHVLNNMHSFEAECRKHTLLEFFKKDKRITETRKRRKMLNTKPRDSKEINFSEGIVIIKIICSV